VVHYDNFFCSAKLHIAQAVLEMKIWIYWSKSNSWIYFYIVLLKKKLENGLVQTKFYWSWAEGLVLIVRTDPNVHSIFLWCHIGVWKSHNTLLVYVYEIANLNVVWKKKMLNHIWCPFDCTLYWSFKQKDTKYQQNVS
jgi:hypothetical protein